MIKFLSKLIRTITLGLIIDPNIILITLDGIRYQEIFNGTDVTLTDNHLSNKELIPNMYNHFIINGVALGNNLDVYASGPVYISLPGYLEITNGKKIKCYTNSCTNIKLSKTLIDEYSDAAVFASWEEIKTTVSNYPNDYIINAGTSYRSNKYINLNQIDYNLPLFSWNKKYRADNQTIEAATDYYIKFRPSFLWVSLGDGDEWAHLGDYENYINSIRSADHFIGNLISLIDYPTVMVITTDHGRGKNWTNHFNYESSRIWLMFGGYGIENKDYVFHGTLHLSDIKKLILNLNKD